MPYFLHDEKCLNSEYSVAVLTFYIQEYLLYLILSRSRDQCKSVHEPHVFLVRVLGWFRVKGSVMVWE